MRPKMHPNNCRFDCEIDTCICTPNGRELLNAAAPELYMAAVKALDYLKSRHLDGGTVGANLEIAISHAKGMGI